MYIKINDKEYKQEVIESLPEFDVETITPVVVNGKTYRLSDIKSADAVDPNKWDTDIQNLERTIDEVKQKAIDDEENLRIQIANAIAERDEFLAIKN